jgi:hypothetical protein
MRPASAPLETMMYRYHFFFHRLSSSSCEFAGVNRRLFHLSEADDSRGSILFTKKESAFEDFARAWL